MPRPSRARATIDGPYELHPEKYLVTAKDHPFNAVQRSGHGDIVDTPDGKTYFVHLMGRPTAQYKRCVLGRETGIQEAEWRDDGWLWLKNGRVPVARSRCARHARRHRVLERAALQFRRRAPQGFPVAPHARARPHLSSRAAASCALIGRESIGSWFEQALVARRVDALLVRRRDHARLLAHRRAPVRRPHRTTTAATTSTISPSPRIPTASASC